MSKSYPKAILFSKKSISLWGFLPWTCVYFFLSATGCGSPFGTENNQTTSTAAPEASYCSTVTNYPGGVTVTGTALYYYRATSLSTGLQGDPTLNKIPYSEIQVKDSSGNLVQCSATGPQGEISFVLPKGAANYSVLVNSRADNAKIKVSVLSDITSNQYYTISKGLSLSDSDTTKSLGNIIAYARLGEDSELKGGAFHILFDIYRANEYIRNTIGNSTWVADKVTVYWKAGFNPNSYRGSSYANSPLSYYSTGNRKLYILGGTNGVVKTVDTDHFDDSVIIHEYGHFMEDVYAKSDSPGGSHNGNAMIDPRLAWSEGWANFFQAAVISNWEVTNNIYSANANTARGKYYIDTVGYSGDSQETGESGSINIKFDLSTDGTTASGQDAVSVLGEGTFREMSVSRTLYKAISSSSVFTNYGADVPFSAVWTAFSSRTSGLASSSVAFRSVGLMNGFLDSIITSSYSSLTTRWNAVISNEMQNKNTLDYGNPLISQAGSCTAKVMTPVNDSGSCNPTSGSYSSSNKLKSNDYYVYYHDGSSTYITLNYSSYSNYSQTDLDLIVYASDYSYFEDCYESSGYQFSDFGGAVRSARRYGSTESGSEVVNLSGLPAGYYLVVVKAYSLNKTNMSSQAAQYTMQLTKNSTTSNLCPTY